MRCHAHGLLVHGVVAQVRDGVLIRPGRRLAELRQHLLHNLAALGGGDDERLEVFRGEEIGPDAVLDRLGHLVGRRGARFGGEHAGCGLLEVPAMQHGEAVEPLGQFAAHVLVEAPEDVEVDRLVVLPRLGEVGAAGNPPQVRVIVDAWQTCLGEQETHHVPLDGDVLGQPRAERGAGIGGRDGHDQQDGLVPALGLVLDRHVGPRGGFPVGVKNDDTRGRLIDSVGGAELVFENLADERLILHHRQQARRGRGLGLEQLVVLRRGLDLRQRVFFELEAIALVGRAHLVDVEAVFNDDRQLGCEAVVVDGAGAGTCRNGA